ncbi:DUF4175 family protein [Sphingomonas albertensis]|uniref:DUF4175 domain-containing protein n=1 Tax=Sphingomonas albertensis TaxID=2762591 RepID=A0ABR7AI59_9SPHN|nr:DUF4175 family protein [Sphingomonas albertensis]MBC3940139.1 DUF4175 domain-containing protein [Sphingomonas albertensis]
MSVETPVTEWAKPARTQSIRDDLLLGTPIVLVTAALGLRLANPATGVGLALLGTIAIVVIARNRARRYDRRWLIGAIDAARSDAEDSTDLLFADPAALTPFQRLQRARVEARLATQPAPDLYLARSHRPTVALWVAAAVAIAAIVLWPDRSEPGGALSPAHEGVARPGVPALKAQRLTVVPPAYTGLPARALGTLDARIPAGSRLEWTLAFAPEPIAASLTVLDGTRTPLAQSGAAWTASRTADRAFLYRVIAQGGQPAPPLHRIDVIDDQPPRIRLVSPAETLVQMSPDQRSWSLSFEATDDYGVQPVASLRIVVAQGEGENVRFSERIVPVRGTGDPRRRIFATTIALAGTGFTEPGDLVAQLTVADARSPAPHRVVGPGIILRRPPASGAESGLEAMTRRTMPAYFSSQRQVIIDAEALLAERPPPVPDRFLARSTSIAEDQRLLRMRYGQFMGEEVGGGATNAMPTSDAEEGAAPPAEQHAGEPPAPAPQFGLESVIVETYGHTHDESEAATLLDPGTRATLRQALDNMRQSETALRLGEPRRALPFAYKALRFIKQVQQATRIFLARTGSQLPPVDLARRLTGDRSDMAAHTLASTAADPIDATPSKIWAALDTRSDTGGLDALARWLRMNEARVPDPLALSAAIDTLRRDPTCTACRAKLRGTLWRALSRPTPGLTRRPDGDAVGHRYLDALP